MTLGIPLPKTSAGKVDRDCPSTTCETRRFQIGADAGEQLVDPASAARMRRPPNTPGITCPYCGHDSADEAFTTNEDQAASAEYLEWAALQDVEDAFAAMVQNAFKGVKGVRVTTPRRSSPSRPHPRPWREDLLRELTCGTCRRRYGVYGFALFCPDCGAANLTEHFARDKDHVEHQLAVAEACSSERERAFRTLTNALEDVVTALETALKGVYVHVVKRRCPADVAEKKASKQGVGNRFQSLERGAELFEFGIDAYGSLTDSQRAELRLSLAKRHVITHNQGIVDAAFAKQTGTGTLGRPVTLTADEVRQFVSNCAAILVHLERTCPELLPPRTREG